MYLNSSSCFTEEKRHKNSRITVFQKTTQHGSDKKNVLSNVQCTVLNGITFSIYKK